jgi:hypothetical protein
MGLLLRQLKGQSDHSFLLSLIFFPFEWKRAGHPSLQLGVVWTRTPWVREVEGVEDLPWRQPDIVSENQRGFTLHELVT